MKPEKKKEPKVLSQEEYERRIKELQDELEELKKVKIEEEKKPERGKIWKPELNEIFYYIEECGEVEKDENTGCNIDDAKFERGNYYKTEEEARHQANIQKYTNLFRKYIEEHSKPLDWSDTSQRKYCLVYTDNFIFDWNLSAKHQGAIYASSEQILKDAIGFVGSDNVIKYVLGVGLDD